MEVTEVTIASTQEKQAEVNKPVGSNLSKEDLAVKKVVVQSNETTFSQLATTIRKLEIGSSNLWDYTKKLLVIDVDNKFLYDTSADAENRPCYYLHEFMVRVSQYYNIVIWSSESAETLKQEMEKLGILNNLHYKITAYLDRQFLINTSSPKKNANFMKHPIIIWEDHPTFSSKNTIVLNDMDEPGRFASVDKLLKLCEYLVLITDVEDFRTLFHSNWREYRKFHQMPQITGYVASVKNIIAGYKVKELNPLESNKKLLILDIDRTIFALMKRQPFKRPYLTQFLTKAYKHYNIAIWSAREMYGIDVVMNWMGMNRHPDYKIAFQLDGAAMVRTNFFKLTARVKPLHVVWGKYRQFSATNTIMLDDQKINFLMNPQSGLLIKPFFHEHEDPAQDVELVKLTDYLEMIASVEDFESLDHNKWEEYIVSKPVSS